jgi:LmbE family N-acetylglucosaminyl deacetylase
MSETSAPAAAPLQSLPAWRHVLAVVAHPDDESFGLGAVLAAFSAAGASTALVCFTHGEASTLHGVGGQLHQVRARELDAAAAALGVSSTTLLRYQDGSLAAECPMRLTGEVLDAARAAQADGLLVFDSTGVTGHPDHAAATAAALAAAGVLDLPVVAWTIPDPVAATLNAERGTGFRGRGPDEIDYVIEVDRTRQRIAAAAHASQALPTSVLWRRLELLGDLEYLRLLRPASRSE